MNTLQQIFPLLTTFSDLNWEAVSKEYEATSIHISFPEYLQLKSQMGDCPPYLYELAFYEMAAWTAKHEMIPFPSQSGIYLNPTALFLQLEFDIVRMLQDSQAGAIEIHERPHVLCLYRDTSDQIHSLELTGPNLVLLQQLEDGPQTGPEFVEKNNLPYFHELVSKGLILTV